MDCRNLSLVVGNPRDQKRGMRGGLEKNARTMSSVTIFIMKRIEVLRKAPILNYRSVLEGLCDNWMSLVHTGV